MEAASSSASLFYPKPTRTNFGFVSAFSIVSFLHPFSRPHCPRRLISSSVKNAFAADNFIPSGTIADSKDAIPKLDKSGRFCSPRAARELALIVLYAACLDGSDPVRLFDKRLNERREMVYEFDKAFLMEYDHMRFGGPPLTTESEAEADEILRSNQKESNIEAEVLSAPPKLVYSKLILKFSRKLLVAVAENWNSNVVAIEKVAPPNWMKDAGGRILEFSVLHLAMSEISVLGTRHQIVINEAVDLAKRFCDGAAPRVLNGCLRNFVQELKLNHKDGVMQAKSQ